MLKIFQLNLGLFIKRRLSFVKIVFY